MCHSDTLREQNPDVCLNLNQAPLRCIEREADKKSERAEQSIRRWCYAVGGSAYAVGGSATLLMVIASC